MNDNVFKLDKEPDIKDIAEADILAIKSTRSNKQLEFDFG